MLRLADSQGKLGTLISMACRGAGSLSSLRSASLAQPRGVGDLDAVRDALTTLAREYESVRASMPKSDERTRRMDAVASRMRATAIGAQTLVRTFAGSESAGERLVAVAILQDAPDPVWVTWLGERLAAEMAFVGYHAAVALRSAARLLGPEHAREVAAAVAVAHSSLGSDDQSSDRARVLDGATRELRGVGAL